MEDILYTRVLQYLNIRPRSEKEIRDYVAKQLAKPKVAKLLARHTDQGEALELIKKDYPAQHHLFQDDNSLTDRIINRLKAAKFLDDLQFALWFIRSRTTFKPKGRRLISLELQQKGIAKELIEQAFIAYDADQRDHQEEERDEVTLAKQLLEKKRKKYEVMQRQERFNKAGSMLARRGFDLDTIKQAIDAVFGK